MYSQALKPGARLGSYPEQEHTPDGYLDHTARTIKGLIRRLSSHTLRRGTRFLARVNERATPLRDLGDQALQGRVQQLRQGLAREGMTESLAVEVFALVREAAHRTLKTPHYDTQIAGGWVLLNGMLAEMETGEGKTLTATLPACVAALAGVPVHIVTANDYLVKRDAESMAPIYDLLGVSVGVITETVTDPKARRHAYRCDVTYCTGKQVAFDYLRDRVALGQRRGRLDLQLRRLRGDSQAEPPLLLRGLCFAIVDEADSVFIDQARTPLILSQRSADDLDSGIYNEALTVAARLENGRDFQIHARYKDIELTSHGNKRVEVLSQNQSRRWQQHRQREWLVARALCAQHLYRKDRDYLVRDGKVGIVDGNTGRVLPDHSWELGLHQLIEVKEGCEITAGKQTLARTSYQRFFRRYLHLSGMTGTAREVAGELWSIYGLEVVRLPTRRPLRRKRGVDQMHATSEAKWRAVVARVAEMQAAGRPVLVGTRSVVASEHLSRLLIETGLPHEVLNARQDQREAEIIAKAGTRGAITVATNMAGRGTDIRLGPGVSDCGGLHVIASERNEARRIDRQLFGRSGRQGDPGSFEVIACAEDDLLTVFLHRSILGVITHLAKWNLPFMAKWSMSVAQRIAQRHDARLRRELMKLDGRLKEMLAFTGAPE